MRSWTNINRPVDKPELALDVDEVDGVTEQRKRRAELAQAEHPLAQRVEHLVHVGTRMWAGAAACV